MNDNPFSNTADIDSDIPSVSSAANDLRSAAGDFVKRTESEAFKLKDRAVETAQALKANAVDRAQHLKEVATEKAEHYKTVAAEKAEHYKAVATDKAQYVRENAHQQWDETRVRAKEIHVTAEDYIRQNPTKAVLGALGVGFLIGLITRR